MPVDKQSTPNFVLATYGLVDGFNAASSTIRLIFDVINDNNSQCSVRHLHEWMQNTKGSVVIFIGTACLMQLSFLNTAYPASADSSQFKQYADETWKTLRPILKSFKNAHKAIRSLIQTINRATHHNLGYLITPIWLVSSILSGLNRIGYRRLETKRKAVLRMNFNLLQAILRAPSNTTWDIVISEQSYTDKILSFISKTYGGIIDGLYLYMGTPVVMMFLSPIFIPLAIDSSIFTLTCLITRIHEESNVQREVLVSIDKIKLAIHAKQLKYIVQIITSESAVDETHHEQLTNKLNEFLHYRTIVRQHLTISRYDAVLNGLTDGLAIYGALSALMFSTYTLALILSCNYPPMLILTAAKLGIFILLVCGTWQGIYHHYQTVKSKQMDIDLNEKLHMACETIHLNSTQLLTLIDDSIEFDIEKQSSIPQQAEVARSTASGIGKGPKAIDFIFNSSQQLGDDGRLHDTPWMLWLMIPCTTLFMFALGFSAYNDQFATKNKTNHTTNPTNARSWCSFFRFSELSFSGLSHAGLITLS